MYVHIEYLSMKQIKSPWDHYFILIFLLQICTLKFNCFVISPIYVILFQGWKFGKYLIHRNNFHILNSSHLPTHLSTSLCCDRNVLHGMLLKHSYGLWKYLLKQCISEYETQKPCLKIYSLWQLNELKLWVPTAIMVCI